MMKLIKIELIVETGHVQLRHVDDKGIVFREVLPPHGDKTKLGKLSPIADTLWQDIPKSSK